MSDLKKIRVQHVDRNSEGIEIKTDVDVLTDADCISMDDGDLRSGISKMINDRIGEVIDGAPEQLDTLKEIAEELGKNQSGVSTIIKAMNSKLEAKDLEGYAKTADVDTKLESKVSVVDGKGLSTNDYTSSDKSKVDALDSLNSNKKLVYKQKRDTDFNSITEAGFYTVTTTTNAPHNQYNYWSLIVLNSTGVDNATYVQQIAINEKLDDRAIYVRKKSSNWTNWIKLEATPDLSNLVTKVNGKGLSSNDFTDSYKQKIDNIPNNAKYTDTTYDLSPYAKKIEVPRSLSQLTNDRSFKTESEIRTMIDSATKLKKEVVTSLPSAGKDDVIYLVKDSSGTAGNVYLEYLWIAGAYELIGSTKMDLSGYAKTSDVDSRINNIKMPSKLSDLDGDSEHRTVTDSDKTNWDAKVSRTEISDFKRCIFVTHAQYKSLSSSEQNRNDTIYYFLD